MSSKIIKVITSMHGRPVFIAPPADRIVGRLVLEWSPYCGTYGQGGPGFLGFRLAARRPHPQEWLMFCLWGAAEWLSVNNCWLSAHRGQYDDANRPLYSNFHNEQWDEFSDLVLHQKITMFAVRKHSLEFRIGEAHIRFTEDQTSRPVFAGTGVPRVLGAGDDLREAWIVAPKPWVRVSD